jgi:hypothetical protein
MVPAVNFKVTPSDFLIGKWRLTTKLFFDDNGKQKISCVRYRMDIVEV